MFALALSLTAVAHGATKPGPYFTDSGHHFYVKPVGTIDLSGTGSWLIVRSHWLTWGPTTATANTTFFTNTCKPSCGAGHYRAQPARVRLSGLVSCRGKEVFDNYLVVSATGKRLIQGNFRSLGYLKDC